MKKGYCMQINAIGNTRFKGNFIRNINYEEIKNSQYTDPQLIEKLEDTLKVVESVDDGMDYYISSVTHYGDKGISHTYYLLQKEGDDYYSQKIIAEQNGTVKSSNKLLTKINSVLSKKYRPYFSVDNDIKEEIYDKLEQNHRFINNNAIKKVLDLPYTTRGQLQEFKNNLDRLTHSKEDKDYYVQACYMYGNNIDHPKVSYGLYSKTEKNLWPSLIKSQAYHDNYENNVLDAINAYLKANV